MSTNKKYIKRTNSKDTLSNFSWHNSNATVYPDFSFDKVIDMVNNDSTARGALNHFVDKCMEGGYNILNKETHIHDESTERNLENKFIFRTNVIRPVFLVGKMFNNVFLEIVKDTDENEKYLNVLDSRQIEPVTKPNGDPIEYYSKIPNPKTGKRAHWTKDEIVWIKFNDIGTGYAPVDLKALWEILLAKEYVRRYVAWLWKTGQYRVIYNFKNANDKDVVDFLVYAKKHDSNFKAPFPAKGELETRILRDMKENESIIELLKYYDSQILATMRIPPMDVGFPDASGRSNADAQSNNLNTHVASMKKVVEDKISYDLFPKINKGNSLLRFNPNDRFQEQMIFDNVQKMKAIGFSNEAIKEYLTNKGVTFSATLFEPKPEILEEGGEEDLKNPKEKDQYVSRQRQDGAPEEKQGTGEQASTRPDQLRKE